MGHPEIEAAGERLRYLELRPFPLLGCPRRNRWSRRPRRSDVGAAVLALLGQKVPVQWLGGTCDVFVSPGGSVLLWRPGPWRWWWTAEAQLLAGMVHACTSVDVKGALVLHEVDGRTMMRYLDCPVALVEHAYRAQAMAWVENGDVAPPRWNRRTERAKVICPQCPVRARCEGVDRELGKTDDWE